MTLHDFWQAVPWPDLGYIGVPSFVLGVLSDRFVLTRPSRRSRP